MEATRTGWWILDASGWLRSTDNLWCVHWFFAVQGQRWSYHLRTLRKSNDASDLFTVCYVGQAVSGAAATGIKDLQTYMDGVNLYLEDTDVTDLYLNGLEGSESYETARDTIRTSIDEEIPQHIWCWNTEIKNSTFFQWHWFLVNGYEETADTFKIKAATYGKAHWMDLGRLWDTGYDHKGGIVTFHFK